MSSDDPSNAPSPSERRDAVREKAQQVQARQRRARRIRITTVSLVAIVVVAVTASVVTWVVSSDASQPLRSPSNMADDGFAVTSVAGVALSSDVVQGATPSPSDTAEPEATPTERPAVEIRVYVDYLSTASRDFQVANVQQLAKWVTEDAATLTYYPVSMLTAKSNGTKYSLRAAGAAACVATHSPDTFFAYNNALLTQQPEVDSGGYDDSELASLAIASGAQNPKTVRTCIEDQVYRGWAKEATEHALEGLPGTDGLALTGTPTVLVNGTPYVGSLTDPKEFAQFVLTLASDAYYQATPTPTATATP